MKAYSHLLIIEDETAVARSLRDGLEREGFQVSHSSTGEEGLAFSRQHHPRLILLDVRLPDGSGFDFCRRFRQAGLRQPIIMLNEPAHSDINPLAQGTTHLQPVYTLMNGALRRERSRDGSAI